MTPTPGLAHSVHVRLVSQAKKMGIEAQFMLERFALHRLLYRLSKSVYSERFVLKGAQLMLVWMGETVRPTRDADLLGFGDLSNETLTQIFREICTQDVEPDGMEYLPDSVTVTTIREADAYGGWRVTLESRLGNARLHLQVDIGIGDAVTPKPEWVELPSLLDFPAPRLRSYRPETSIAEKLETMVSLGLQNSRMKDYFDIYVLSEYDPFDGHVLCNAVRNTFRRRDTAIPNELPMALSREFAMDPGKAAQWTGFLRRIKVDSVPTNLAEVVDRVARFLGPVLAAVRDQEEFSSEWPPGGPWKAKTE
jgi:predicted nucleotidyltransferase component of viral defense system